MKVFNYRDVEEEVEEGAQKTRIRRLITRETGAENFTMRLFEIDPGGSSPFHSHAWEHEVFVLEGRGILKGECDQEFRGGDVIFIPPNETHQLKNIGKKPVKFICLIPYKKTE